MKALKYHKYCGLFMVGVSLLTLASCSKTSTDTIYMTGSIREAFVNRLQAINKPNTKIIITSSGGLPRYSMSAADSIIKNRNDVIIAKECSSACAEYLLPVARTIEFKYEPIIGFHWNSIINFHQLEKYGGDVSKCDLSEVDNLKSLYRHNNLNPDFWRETLKKLQLEYYQVVPKGDGCPWKKRRFRNDWWLPTSKQLRELWGLEFTGTICADNFNTCTTKMDHLYKKGIRIVIGDEVYVSKGHR